MKNFAIKLAKEASKILMGYYGKIGYVKVKKGNTLVTDVDFKVDKKLISMIKKQYPEHSILTEESGLIDKKSDYKWIIDPLDGTHNYITGLPLFGTSIALEHKGEVKVGVISIPCLKMLFVAEKGKGCYGIGSYKRLKVSATKRLNYAMVMLDGSIHRKTEQKTKLIKKLAKKFAKARISGVAIVDLSFVALGLADAHYALETNPWDVAAGFLIIKEAGGKITDFKGKEVDHYTNSFAATNGKIHKELLKIF